MFDHRKGAPRMENENEEQPGEEVEPEKSEQEGALSQEDIISALLQQAHDEEMESMRAMGLYGDINEEKAQEVINALMMLWDSSKSRDPEGKEIQRPFDFYISTNGGSADDMFAIYDLMTVIKNSGVDIGTVGLGKVMSAGVLLLAAGTKGKRRVARNCRIMIHSVIGGQHGPLHNLENEMDEIRQISEMYMRALVEETDLTTRRIKQLLDRKVNVYLSAEEAIEYGIADEIYGEEKDG
tara:strand:+ start:2109 stop:2825 length:717 start_codon:yes stop_codon:yes gene_type:complete